MHKIYHLSTCNTCQRIIAALDSSLFELQDIKTQPITPDQIDFLREKLGSYEALFSRRARKYRSLGLAGQALSEADYRRLILEEYTFLKRPVIVIGDQVFAGNSKKTLEAALAALQAS